MVPLLRRRLAGATHALDPPRRACTTPNLFTLPPCAFLSQVAYFYAIYFLLTYYYFYFLQVAYFYAIYFLILLIHRAIRDDHFCREKYGHDWQEYKKKVPAVFVPGII